MRHNDREFESRIKAQLDEDLDALDPAISQRLQRARKDALDTLKPARYPIWQPAVGFALAILLVMAVVIWPWRQPGSPSATALADFDLIAADDSLQLFEELDFYEWLAESEINEG